MRKTIPLSLLFILLSTPLWGQAGTTAVTATVVDTNGSLYVNCQWSAEFVGQNTTPGAGPYKPEPYTHGQQGHCDSQGNFSVNLADNINTITPTPSQWNFSICSAPGYPQGPFCKTNILITITGATQDLTSTLTPLMPLLPTQSSGGTTVFPGVPTGACTPPQTGVNQSNGDLYSCNGGVWNKVGPGAGAAGNPGGSPFQVQTNNNGASFNGITNAATGSWMASAGTSAFPVFQVKPIIDIRDKTSCGAGDDTAAFATLLTAIGTTPTGLWMSCQINLGTTVIPSNVILDPTPGGSIFVQTGQVVTIRGPINNVPRQIFFNIASGQGILSFSGNRSMTTYSPLWFGVDCTGIADNGPIWNQIMAFTGEDTTFLMPQDCTQNFATQVDVPSRSGVKFTTTNRGQNGAGGNRVKFQWSGTTGGMLNFIANQEPTIEGIDFENLSTAHLDYFIQLDGNPGTRIGTEAIIRYNTFNNHATNPTVGGLGRFDAIKINVISGQNHEKNIITDNDFFCSGSSAFRESNSTQITSGSQNVTCGLLNCHYTTHAAPGDRVRISYATGILDTTIQSITDDNHLVTVDPAASNQSNARITFRQAWGNGITIGSVNSKHNTISRNGFTQCNRGVNIVNGSFSGEHFGGSANDTLLYINNIAEPSEVSYVEDENSMRDVYMGTSVDAPLIMNHLRNSLGIAGEYDGFIYFAGSGQATIRESVIQDSPNTNQIVIGAANPSTFQLNSIANRWTPGVINMANLGFTQWRTFAEGAATGLGAGFLISCGDYFAASDPPGVCFQFGDGGISSGANEGHVTVSSSRFGNYPTFSLNTAEPNVQVNTFLNEAIGYKTNFLGFNNSTTMKWIGFDAQFKQATRGGNFAGFRAGFPTVDPTSTQMPFARGLWVQAPTGNTDILNGYGVYVEDLTTHTGITNHYSFFGVGATDTAHFGGPTETLGPFTFTADNTTDIGAAGATRPRTGYFGTSVVTPLVTTTTVNAAAYQTATNCSANGSAVNPSIVNCGAASAGHFSCDVAASGGTCHINTTAVTVNSEIFVTDSDTFTTGAGLGVTCNNAPTGVPAILLVTQVGGSSFDINVATITVNPACYSYFIVN